MEKDTKLALQVAKEIVVKFIEVGRISPTNFHSVFPSVYAVVLNTIANQGDGSVCVDDSADAGKNSSD